ncbi:hypothetical protein ACTID9_06115 [Brevibacillus fluminis]|uniref:hypothetical protein n=1 Tax=Brevibacillus fluminis TaxID=511487 RepID=UPI003F8AA0D6
MKTIQDNEEIKKLYDELWVKLQAHDEIYVKRVINNWSKKLDKRQNESIINYLKASLKKPMFWIIFILLLVIVPSIFFFLFIWLALLVD